MKNNLIKNRFKYATRAGRVLATFPFVRCVILNGSLALGTSKESSDIDILIVAKTGRIFTTRFFINGFTTILGIKRSKIENSDHSGDFCFNYFLTDSFLKIPDNRESKINEYCAENYSKSIFIAGDPTLFTSFMRANKELFDKYHCAVRHLADNDVLKNRGILQKILEFAFSGFFGDWFERTVKRHQIRMIESDPITAKYPKHIVYNDQELRFHPPKAQNR